MTRINNEKLLEFKILCQICKLNLQLKKKFNFAWLVANPYPKAELSVIATPMPEITPIISENNNTPNKIPMHLMPFCVTRNCVAVISACKSIPAKEREAAVKQELTRRMQM